MDLQRGHRRHGRSLRAFGTPITGGNVSFYNETLGKQIMPTPVIGVVGLLDDMGHRTGQAFRAAGDVVLVLGETRKEIGGSEYLEVVHGLKRGPVPALDLQRELNLQGAVRDMIREGLLASAHDVSDGGLAMALAECCFASPDPATGLEATLDEAPGAAGLREDALLFGETQSRVVVSAAERHADRIRHIAERVVDPLRRRRPGPPGRVQRPRRRAQRDRGRRALPAGRVGQQPGDRGEVIFTTEAQRHTGEIIQPGIGISDFGHRVSAIGFSDSALRIAGLCEFRCPQFAMSRMLHNPQFFVTWDHNFGLGPRLQCRSNSHWGCL